MPSTRRKDRVATTFWLDKKLKDKLQLNAQKMGSTLTELINRSIQIYLEKGYVHDDELSQRLAVTEITDEIGQSSALQGKLSEYDDKIKGLTARVQTLEEEKQKEERITSEAVQNQISIHFESKVQPLMVRLEKIISSLMSEQ